MENVTNRIGLSNDVEGSTKKSIQNVLMVRRDVQFYAQMVWMPRRLAPGTRRIGAVNAGESGCGALHIAHVCALTQLGGICRPRVWYGWHIDLVCADVVCVGM